jgi:DNA-binding transcriptional ArsR family regulator
MAEETFPTVDTRLAKALSHPLRRRLLVAYSERPSSPSEVATALGEPLNEVAYHTQRLLAHGCVALVREEQRRGRMRRIYRATVPFEFEDAEWQGLPQAARGTVVGQILETLWGELAAAAESGALAGEDIHVSRLRLELDDEAWEAASQVLRHAVDELKAIGEASARRGAAQQRDAVVALLGFEPA